MTRDYPEWPAADAERYRAAGYWIGITFGEMLANWARGYARRTALVDGSRRLSYSELDTEARKVAACLREIGIQRGDRVIMQLPNIAEFVVAWFALQRIGAVPVHAMPAHRRAEIGHLAELSGAVGYLIPDRQAQFDYRELAEQIREQQRGSAEPLKHIIVVGDVGEHDFYSFSDFTKAQPEANFIDPPTSTDLALLLLSGGTTGPPKLIPRTHDDYAYNARASAEACLLTENSVYLAVLPIAFNFTWACPGVLGTLTVGGIVVLAPNPSPETVFALIASERVTITAASPPLIPHWLAECKASQPNLSSLRVLQVGSARLADDLARKIEPAFGARLQQVFGMAEGLLNYTRLDDTDELICTTQGAPLSPDDEIRVVNDNDRPVSLGEPGELLTRGPYTLRGYYRSGERDQQAFAKDGFYRTGDVVRQLPSGHLVVVGRVKDQINRGGEKIPAIEVEGHLLAHPEIRGAALVPRPDPVWGEVPVAFIICQKNPPSEREIAIFLRERGLATFKIPAQIVAIDQFPLTAVGKIDKKILVEKLRS
jgi:2,3-dihydroxybenzoate-AMP ligase